MEEENNNEKMDSKEVIEQPEEPKKSEVVEKPEEQKNESKIDKEEKSKEDIVSFKLNPMKLVVAILGISLIISLAFNFLNPGTTTPTGYTVASAEEVNAKIITYVKAITGSSSVSIKDITEENGLYKVSLEVSGNIYSSYATKDGSLLFPQAFNLDNIPQTQGETQPTQQDIPKSDKPVANAFVMSYCPYGLQFMKAYIPVMELLGEKAELNLNFVNYAMHGKKEIDENTRMYCIQKEQKDKFTAYLRCFVETDDYNKCIIDTGIDKTALDSCISATDAEFNITALYNDQSTWLSGNYPVYKVDNTLNQQYGVRGSPTFIVNGVEAQADRTAESIKEGICNAFNIAPAECSQTLSTSAEAPGIGKIGVSSGSGTQQAQCG